MSIAYDAKQSALKAYPNECEDGVKLMLQICDVSASDFAFNEGVTAGKYLYRMD